ncbi:hypothetical protein MTP99_010160 [Tenebrio molitor]|nr:hypothetical protein MTP99_010160 [Tenebrio molitor]
MVDGPRRFIISMQTCNPSKIESRLYLKTARVDRNRWRVGTTRKGSWRRFVGRDLAGRGCYGNERCNLGDRTEGAFLKELGWVAIILLPLKFVQNGSNLFCALHVPKKLEAAN